VKSLVIFFIPVMYACEENGIRVTASSAARGPVVRINKLFSL